MIFFTKLFEARILLSPANYCDLVNVNFISCKGINGDAIVNRIKIKPKRIRLMLKRKFE